MNSAPPNKQTAKRGKTEPQARAVKVIAESRLCFMVLILQVVKGWSVLRSRMAGFSLKTSEKRKGRYRYKQYPPFPLRFSLEKTGNVLFSRAVSSQVHSALRGLTSVFGMGTGGSLLPLSPVWLSVFCTLTTTQHSP